MSGNIPGNNRIPPKTQTFTRALGSTTVHANGWRPAARGANPYDTQSMKVGMYARARAQANIYAGRNSVSFGQLAQPQQASSSSGMSPMEMMMMAQMGLGIGKGITDVVNAFKSDKTASPSNPDLTTPTPPGNVGKGGKTSADAKTNVETKKQALDSAKADLGKVDLAGIASCTTTNLSAIKDKYGINIDLTKLSSMQNITFSEEVPTKDEIKTVDTNAELVASSLKSASTGIGKLTDAASTVSAKLQQLKNAPLDERDNAQITELEQQLEQINSAKDELETLKGKLEEANGSLQQLAKTLPDVVKEYEKAKEEQEEIEQKEVKQLQELASEVNSAIDKMANGKKVEKNRNKLAQLAEQITSLKTLVAEHQTEIAERSSAIQAADTALNRINELNLTGDEDTPTIDGDKVSAEQIAEMNKKYGVNLELDKEYQIGGTKFKITNDGQFTVGDQTVGAQDFFKKLSEAKSKLNVTTMGGGSFDTTAINNMLSGNTLTIGNTTYTKTEDGKFRNEQGNEFTLEQLQRVFNSDIRIGM